MTTSLQTTASIDVEVDTLNIRNNITGVISLRVNDHYFPEREWNDFPIIILDWWLTNLLSLWRDEPDTADGVDCLFMDGDYSYRVTPHDDRWSIDFTDDEIVYSIEVERAAFMREVLNCAAHTLDFCRARGWRSTDIDNLATKITHVEAELLSQTA